MFSKKKKDEEELNKYYEMMNESKSKREFSKSGEGARIELDYRTQKI